MANAGEVLPVAAANLDEINAKKIGSIMQVEMCPPPQVPDFAKYNPLNDMMAVVRMPGATLLSDYGIVKGKENHA